MSNSGKNDARRFSALGWGRVRRGLAARGYAHLQDVLTPGECAALARLSGQDGAFNKSVDMEKAGFGRGVCGYLADTPPVVVSLQRAFYENTVGVANKLIAAAKKAGHNPFGTNALPKKFDDYARRCADEGRPLEPARLIHYPDGGFTAPRAAARVEGDILHPLQLIVQLKRRGPDFEGGEIILEQLDRRPPEPGAGYKSLQLDDGPPGPSVQRSYHSLLQGGGFVMVSALRAGQDGAVVPVKSGIERVFAPGDASGRTVLGLPMQGRRA